jgi:PEP-CTERM putative exosortase interaction domain
VIVSLSGSSAVNTTLNAPTENVFAHTEFTGTNSGLAWRNDPTQTPVRRDIGQSFYTGSESVIFDKITFKSAGANIPLVFQDNADIKFTLSIYEVPTASAFPSTEGSKLISSQEGDFAGFAAGLSASSGNIAGTAFNYITFDFDDVALNANSYYMVVLSFNQSAAGLNLALGNNGSNSYFSEGTGAFAADGGAWGAASDFYFYAQSAPVPEPGTSGAFLLGGLLLSLSRWGRRARG